MSTEWTLVDVSGMFCEDVASLVGAVLEVLPGKVADVAVDGGEGKEMLVVGLEMPDIRQLHAEDHSAAGALVKRL